MGLLLRHKSTVSVYPDMISLSENHSKPETSGGKRGEIKVFSRESRYRLFRLFHTLSFERFSFVTLTYGATYPSDGRGAKLDLKAYRRSFERKWGKIPCVWRLEFQERGAPHFHLLYLDPPFIPVRDWNILWDKSRHCPMGERSGNSLDLKVCYRRSDSDVVSKYVGKYISKPDERNLSEIEGKPGRWWGKWNIEDVEPVKVELYPAEVEQLKRLILPTLESGGWTPTSTDNFTLFGSTMGTDNFQKRMTRAVAKILEGRARIEGR